MLLLFLYSLRVKDEIHTKSIYTFPLSFFVLCVHLPFFRTQKRLFDGACDYGNEVEIGKGIARAIKDGLVKREDLFGKCKNKKI